MNPTTQEKNDYFNSVFERIRHELAFNSAWLRDATSLKNMVTAPHAVQANPNEVFKGVDSLGRKFIYMHTVLGGVVIYQRKKDGEDGVYLNHHDYLFNDLDLLPNGPMTLHDMMDVLGTQHTDNLAQRLDTLTARVNMVVSQRRA